MRKPKAALVRKVTIQVCVDDCPAPLPGHIDVLACVTSDCHFPLSRSRSFSF